MKRVLAILLVAVMLIGMLTVAVSADNATECTEAQKNPDWLITEIVCDTSGDGKTIDGYDGKRAGKDIFEMMEIYNNSGKTLNLYDYCMTYNGTSRGGANFEQQIKEITPFLTNNTYEDKAGNYLDGSTFATVPTTYTQTLEDGSTVDYTLVLNDTMKNPDTCYVEPGECVVLWVMYYEPYLNCFHDNPATPEVDGTGATKDDFREFYGIPADVKVICVDGNSDVPHGGNDGNFNIKNSACGTYGIALYDATLNSECNVIPDGATTVTGRMTDGGYWADPNLICWASYDIASSSPSKADANYSANFVPDIDKRAAAEWGYVWSGGRMYGVESGAVPTPGKLTTLQQLYINPSKFAANDKISFKADNMLEWIYTPYVDSTETQNFEFEGWLINGTLCAIGDEYTVPAGGIKTFELSYLAIDKNTKPVETDSETPEQSDTDAPNPSDTPAGSDTDAPSDSKTDAQNPSASEDPTKTDAPNPSETKAPTKTDAPKTDAPKTDAPATTEEPKKGCGGMAGIASAFAVICGVFGVAIIKKH